jgi:hypothetical protein
LSDRSVQARCPITVLLLQRARYSSLLPLMPFEQEVVTPARARSSTKIV